MEVKVSVNRRYVKDGPIEMYISTSDNKGGAAAILDNDHYGEIALSVSISASEIEYVTPLLNVVKEEYEKLLQDRKDK